MADISDVLNSIAAFVANALYPSGALNAQGDALPSVAGPIVKILRGTPFAKQLDEDMRAGVINVTINQRVGVGRTTTRFPTEWSTQSIQAPTLNVAVSGNAITLGGTVTPGQGILLILDGQPYAYLATASDTLPTIAAALATSIKADRPVTVLGAALSIPALRTASTRYIVQGVAIRPTRQQTSGIVIKVFAPSFATRDEVAIAVDSALANISRLSQPDGSVAMIRSTGTAYDDQPQKALTLVRTLLYQVEYSTTQTEVETAVAVLDGIISPLGNGGSPGPVVIVTDAGPPRQPLPSDLNVLVKAGAVVVDRYGNPEVKA